MTAVCPGATFLFTAHYPETRLDFVVSESSEPLPTLIRDPGNTVWGGVFEIPADQIDALITVLGAGRKVGYDYKAVDREGNKHDCLTFVSETEPGEDRQLPDPGYVDSMIRGAKHWSLPAGWVMGLEDLVENPLFS